MLQIIIFALILTLNKLKIMSTSIIIAVVSILLLVIGTIQRKKILLLVRSETNTLLDGSTNNVKVINLKISELRKQIKDSKQLSGKLFAESNAQNRKKDEVTEKIETALANAKKYKEDGNNEASKFQLQVVLDLEKQLEIINNSIKLITTNKIKLESRIAKAARNVEQFNIKIKSIEASKSVNKLLKNVVNEGLSDSTLEEYISESEDENLKETDALDYQIEGEDRDTEFEAKINEIFETL